MADSPDFVDRLPRRDADRRGAGAGLDDAARRRASPSCCATRGPGSSRSAREFADARGRRPPADGAGAAPGCWPPTRRRPPRRAGAPARRPGDAPRRTASAYADRRPTRPRSGSTPRAPPARRRRDAPARLDPGRLRDLRHAGARHPARTTAACRRPRRSSPTGSATRCCSRCRSARPRVLEPAPSRPDAARGAGREVRRDAVLRRPDVLRQHAARASCRPTRSAGVRLAVSAGEALPAALYQRWTGALRRRHPRRHRHDRDAAHLPVQPARRGPARHDRRRRARLRPAHPRRGRPRGRPGHARARCSSAATSTATGYWSRYDASRQVFQGEWLRTGDTYVRDADGYYTCLGRTGDMLKASGIWVSPGGGGGPAARPRRRSPRRSWSPRPTPTAWRSRSPTWSCAAGRRRSTEDELIEFCRAGPAVVQAAAHGRVRRRLPDHGDRQDPPGRAARRRRRLSAAAAGRRRGGDAPDARRAARWSTCTCTPPGCRRSSRPGRTWAQDFGDGGDDGAGLRRRRHGRPGRVRRATWPTRASTSRCCSPSTARRSPASSRSRTCCR